LFNLLSLGITIDLAIGDSPRQDRAQLPASYLPAMSTAPLNLGK
jgi:hypothetical protein